MIDKDVEIPDNFWLGDRVLFLGGVEIGEGTIIQAGPIVVSNAESLAIVGGNPAKVFKHRNSAHYYKMKEEKRFV